MLKFYQILKNLVQLKHDKGDKMNDLYDVPEFLTQEFTIVTLDKEPTNIQEGIEVFKM